MNLVFLKAEWRKLLMINYEVDPEILKPFLPAHTELDLYNGKCLVSIVGFLFLDTKIKGIKIPFHVNFEEVNLRFYITHTDQDNQVKRGTSFIKEIVPRRAITIVANTLYKEKYVTLPMSHLLKESTDQLEIGYYWKCNRVTNSMYCKAGNKLQSIKENSIEEFITEHYWGYTQLSKTQTSEYAVEHPRWEIYPIIDLKASINFESLYGKAFSSLMNQNPHSVLLAEGSKIIVRKGKKLS